MRKAILSKFKESALSVLPITALVAVLALTLTDISTNMIWMFLIGAVLLIMGMALFTLGADVAMMPMGQSVGSLLSKTKRSKFWQVVLIGFVIGFVITIAEPDLLVLAGQLYSGSGGFLGMNINVVLLCSVAAGVGIFLVVSIIRTFFNIKLTRLLLGFYVLIFALGVVLQFVNPEFLALAFDSGGVTTGPITVPFLMALGLGIASLKGSKNSQDDSFGMVALCSVGPILAVMILGLTKTTPLPEPSQIMPIVPELNSFGDIMTQFGHGFLDHMLEIAMALGPIIIVFFIFQVAALRLPKSQIIRIVVGIAYTYVGLTLFMTGVSVGFQPMGFLLGQSLAGKSFNYILIPLGMLMGCLVVIAEPAIHVLNKQVEEVTGGAISKRAMLVFLAVGVAISVGLAMLRVLTGLSIWWFIVPVYAISLLLMFFVPTIFTGIAFDSGGVASGPMTATFMLPMALGACEALGGNLFTDAYGLVAFVAMTPLIMIQLMGLIFKLKTKRLKKRTAAEAVGMPSEILPVDFDTEDTVDFDTDDNITVVDDEEFDDIDTTVKEAIMDAAINIALDAAIDAIIEMKEKADEAENICNPASLDKESANAAESRDNAADGKEEE